MSDSAPIKNQTRRPRTFWLCAILGAVFAAEFLLFDSFGSRRHTAIYPRWNDQIQYLGEAYAAHEHAREHGLLPALAHTLTNPTSQGTLHDTGAVLIFALAGPSRSAALALNMIALIAWQAALALAVFRQTRSAPLSGLAAMLPLGLAAPWQTYPGSAYDFRLDHLALCAFGATSALALLTEGFQNRRWCVAFGAAVGVTLMTRFLTGAYFIVLLVFLSVWVATRPGRGDRMINLGLATAVAAALAAPVFWLNREHIWNYYWIGHYIGPESAIRNQGMGIIQSLRFVSETAARHAGTAFAALAVFGVGLLRMARRDGSGNRSSLADSAMLGAAFLAAPAFVLTLHAQKSDVTTTILLPGLVVLVVVAWRWASRDAPVPRRGAIALSAAAVAATLGHFAWQQRRPAYDAATEIAFRQVNTLADRILQHARAAGRDEPRIAIDHITDSLDAQVLRIVWYERHRIWLPCVMTLPTGIAAPTREDVIARLTSSDFVFLTREKAAEPYPFDRFLAELRPELEWWCEMNLRHVEEFTWFGRRLVLYQRRDIPLL